MPEQRGGEEKMRRLVSRVCCSLTLFACGADKPEPKPQREVGFYCSTFDKACREASVELYAGTCTVTIAITPQSSPKEKTKKITHTFKYFTASDTAADHATEIIFTSGKQITVDFDYKDRPAIVSLGRTSWMRFDDRDSQERFHVIDRFIKDLIGSHPVEIDPRSLISQCWPDASADDRALGELFKP